MPKPMKTARRRLQHGLLLALLPAAMAIAQQPPKLEPLPEVPPPPQMQIDPSLEPQVTVKKRGEDKVEEFRINGKLYMIRVTPPHGVPYLLIDRAGNGEFGPSHGPTDGRNISVPMWVIGTF
jgi:Protein of unknown function (DUF2782)